MSGMFSAPASERCHSFLAQTAGRSFIHAGRLAFSVLIISVILVGASSSPLDSELYQTADPLASIVSRRTLRGLVDYIGTHRNLEEVAPSPTPSAVDDGQASETKEEVGLTGERVGVSKLSLPIHFVTSYTNVGENELWKSAAVPDRRVPPKYIQCLESAKKFHPDAKLVVLTDNYTQFEDTEGLEFTVVREDVFRRIGTGISARYQVWSNYIEGIMKARDRAHVVFVDQDVLFVNSIAHIFEPGLGPASFVGPDGDPSDSSWGAGLTYCNKTHTPAQTGLLFVNGRQIKDGLQFLRGAAWFLHEVHGRAQITWHADRKILVKSLDPANARGVDAPSEWYYTNGVNGIRILMLPCTKYNWSPWRPAKTGEVASDSSIKMVHFKAMNPMLMRHVWEAVRSGHSLMAALSTLPLPRGGHTMPEGGKLKPGKLPTKVDQNRH
eukprot:jgi/Mesen1/8470/ME000478S07967